MAGMSVRRDVGSLRWVFPGTRPTRTLNELGITPYGLEPDVGSIEVSQAQHTSNFVMNAGLNIITSEVHPSA